MDKYNKYRHEFKYILSEAQVLILQQRMKYLMRPDPNTGKDGCYYIRSLYLDDYGNSCFYENENGVDKREKYRVRIYNHSPDYICLERKRKERQKTQKIGCRITRQQAEMIAKGCCAFSKPGDPPLLRLVEANMKSRYFRPAVIVEYERIPFIYHCGNVRITFDINISSSICFDRFFEKDISCRPVMPLGMHLLEVKYDEFLPDFIYRGLQLDSLELTSYSKFYLCRKLQRI